MLDAALHPNRGRAQGPPLRLSRLAGRLIGDVEDREAAVAVAAMANAVQAADPLRDLQLRPMTEHHDGAGFYQRGGAQRFQDLDDVRVGVWRIEDDEVVGLLTPLEECQHGRVVDGGALLEAGMVEVPPDHRDGGALLIDEVGPLRAPGQRFDADGSRSRIQIEYAVR